LYPGELAKIIRQRIAPYRDRTLQGRLSRARSEVQQRLDNAWRDAGGSELAKQMEALAEQANEIAAEQAERIRQIMEETEERLQEFDDKADELDEQARKISSNLDVELPERPQPEITGPDRNVLFDSRRHWLDQLAVFKARQNGHSNGGDS
jgi:DNA repair exonuclease SbcCD ATPase subunit